MFFKRFYVAGDRFEDRARARLSHVPLIYAALGGAGIILFWRGIWHTADYIVGHFFATRSELANLNSVELPWWDGPLSIVVGAALLLSIGLFVTSFIGDAIIISGLKSGKKLTEKTEKEILAELKETDQISQEIHAIHKQIRHFEKATRVLTDERKTPQVPKARRIVKRRGVAPILK